LALDGVCFFVAPGEIFVLLGGPASGKTTLLGLLLGAATPTRGRALIEGIDAASDPIRTRSRLVFVTAQAPVYRNKTTRENVAFFARFAGAQFPRSAVANALRRAGIAEREFDRRPDEANRSLAVRLWLAVALLRDTPVVLLDEPTHGLAPTESAEIQESLSDLKGRSKAVLVTTSDVWFATQAADRVGILNAGRKTAEKLGADLVSHRLTDLSVDYGGSPLRPVDAQSRRTE
jgi:ABC-2 type transport system ATP-binding protein